ncbi:MAG TPA: RNA polymerase sigma factor [Polyangiaceae bacterium]|nr:RNA polymerase sigma factor [Polyangiaceae bacterium]
MHPIDNATLVRDVSNARSGNRAALEAVVRAIEPFINRLALRFFGCPHFAQDAAQEALVRIVVKLDSFDTQSAFSTWAYRVAINKFLSMARSPAERQSMSFEEFDEDLARPTETAEHPEADTDLSLSLAELRIGCTLAMLLCLERDARLAYILGAIVELDHQAAAEILECSAATYRKRLERARDAITGLMKKRCGVFDGANGCQCADRIPIAKARGHLKPDSLVFASSVEQVRRFPEVLTHIRKIEEVQRAAEIYRSHPDPISRGSFVEQLQHLLDSGLPALDQG